MKKYKIGYTQGVYDMFHVGHLNLINRAKEQCETLVVGINSDSLVEEYKNKKPVINETDRMLIVQNIKAVDKAFLADTLDKNYYLDKIGFDVIFIGSDWKNDSRWIKTKEEMNKKGIDVVFLPHTDGITSTMLRDENKNKIEG